MITLNIGHNINGRPALTTPEIIATLRHRGLAPSAWATLQSDTERTTVVQIDSAMVDSHAVAHVAAVLGQDCIALWNDILEAGELLGPRAAAWGAFNPEFFLMPDGSRLGAAVAA